MEKIDAIIIALLVALAAVMFWGIRMGYNLYRGIKEGMNTTLHGGIGAEMPEMPNTSNPWEAMENITKEAGIYIKEINKVDDSTVYVVIHNGMLARAGIIISALNSSLSEETKTVYVAPGDTTLVISCSNFTKVSGKKIFVILASKEFVGRTVLTEEPIVLLCS